MNIILLVKRILLNVNNTRLNFHPETQRSEPSFIALSALTLVVKVLTLDWPSSLFRHMEDILVKRLRQEKSTGAWHP